MISAILVDDEDKSLRNLSILLEDNCKTVNVIATATNALEAVSVILSQKPDLVFLDVQMPGYNGFDVLDQIQEAQATVIFTTAHKEYAINSLRKGAFDYLLKPVDIDELRSCIERATQKINKENEIDLNANKNKGIIELSVKDGIIYIRQEQIVRLEASGSYTLFFMTNNVRHLVSKSMKEYEAHLDPTLFFRCHNSHIINLSMVAKFNNNNGYFAELTNGAVVEIARRNKELFLQRLKKMR